MFDAYSVAIKLSLVNNVTSGLLLLSRSLQSTHSDAQKLQDKLTAIGKQAAIGGAMLGGGAAIAGMFKGPLEEAFKYQREMAKLQQQGLSGNQIAEARRFVEATDIIGSSIQDRIKLFTEAQGAFRESGMQGPKALEAAKVMMPVLTKYQVASSMLSEEKHAAAEHGMLALNRVVEQMGGLNDPKRAAQIVDAGFRAISASGRMVNPEQLRQFRSYGGAAVANITDKAMFASLEPIIGELKGSTTATGLNTAWSRANGLIKPPNQMAGEYIKLGLWDENQIVFNSQGGIKKLKSNPLKKQYADLMNQNPVDFAEVMMEIYKKNKITGNEIARTNAMLFGRTGGKVYDLIMRQMPVLRHSEHAYEASKGIEETIKNNANSPIMKAQELAKAIKDLKLAVGQDLLPVFTPLITNLAKYTKELSKSPELIQKVTVSLAGFATVLVVGGLINVVAAATRGFMLLYTVMGGIPAALMATNASFVAWRTVMLSSAASFGLVKGAVAAFVAYQAGYMVGNWLNENLLNPLIEFFTNGREKTLGGWLYGLFNDEKAAMGPMKYGMVNGKMIAIDGDYPKQGNPFNSMTQSVPVPPKQPITINIAPQAVNIDGKKVAEVVTAQQTREATKPMTGLRGFDAVSSVVLPTMPSSFYPRG
ncbi:hypothetical protein [Chromobacterium haemolyticum]|uniref:Phage tail tape measure protein n=1 Tax=Chromobacterium haemolyticum TaxID=394935 RepID=A0A1W0D5Q4_9NEIS|nr:hypothetical protein [Chromobacterium haemolyticum]OQS42341.1 hypothetical protein B0T45_06015 [Chromobacterium haemolyticum]